MLIRHYQFNYATTDEVRHAQQPPRAPCKSAASERSWSAQRADLGQARSAYAGRNGQARTGLPRAGGEDVPRVPFSYA